MDRSLSKKLLERLLAVEILLELLLLAKVLPVGPFSIEKLLERLLAAKVLLTEVLLAEVLLAEVLLAEVLLAGPFIVETLLERPLAAGVLLAPLLKTGVLLVVKIALLLVLGRRLGFVLVPLEPLLIGCSTRARGFTFIVWNR